MSLIFNMEHKGARTISFVVLVLFHPLNLLRRSRRAHETQLHHFQSFNFMHTIFFCWKHFFPTQYEQKKKKKKKKRSGDGTSDFLPGVQHRRALSQFKRKRWFSVRDLDGGGSCINTVSASLSPLASCTTPDGRRTQTQTRSWDAAWTLLLPSLSTPTPAALEPFTGWNTQRSAPSAGWVSACVRSHQTSQRISSGRSGSSHVPQEHLGRLAQVPSGEECVRVCVPAGARLAQVCESQWWSRFSHHHHHHSHATLSVQQEDRCPQCWILWPQKGPWSIQPVRSLHWERQEELKAAGGLLWDPKGRAAETSVAPRCPPFYTHWLFICKCPAIVWKKRAP